MIKFICPKCGKMIEVISPNAIVYCNRCNKQMVKEKEISVKITKQSIQEVKNNDNE
jgi:DNA-directed RNA polymerase subunit RPC12/RpoP